MSGPGVRRRPRAAALTIAFLGVLGIAALAGGLVLVARPDGSLMGFSTGLLTGSPFSDFLVPGIVLGGLFGIGSLVVAAAGARQAIWAPFAAFAIGCGQMIWIVVELGIIRELSFLHPAMFAVGLAIAAAAMAWGWPTFAAWRHADRSHARPNFQRR
ncbi:MAG TPA: hypothetical protein VFI34_10530 [Candidatus Limnocylindrales bacterium]|nr:hypothetical protein [Candidatus Limnocylindrales bacterium]